MQDDNPYAAPTALVADAAPLPQGTRPRMVSIALRLLWLSLGLNTVSMGVSLAGMSAGTTATVGTAVGYALLLALGAWLNVCTGRGRNWARVILLLFTVVNVLAWPFLPSDPGLSAFEWALTLASMALDVAAMCLLFTRAASPWFK